ncbi:MAG TPA: hypothetical protein VII99_05310 [Bacteroidia bacterium]
MKTDHGNEYFIPKIFRNNRGAARNIVFLLLVLGYNYFLGDYLLIHAGWYMEASRNIPRNPGLGSFLFLILILDFIAFVIKFRAVKYTFLENIDLFTGRKGCLMKLQEFVLGVAAFFSIITGFFLQLMITNSTGNYLIGFVLVLFVFFRWGFMMYKVFSLTNRKKQVGEKIILPEQPSFKSELWSDILLTITTSVIYTVTWGVLRLNAIDATGPFFLVLFFSIPIYLPTRLIFILQDYYSPLQAKNKRNAFLTSVAAVFIPLLNTFSPIPQNIIEKSRPKIVLDDFSAADTMVCYPTDSASHFLFIQTKNVSFAESDSMAHALIKEKYFTNKRQSTAALKKDRLGYIITITLPDNQAEHDEKIRAPFVRLRNKLQVYFPGKKIRIYLGGYNDGSNIIAKIE